MKANRVNVDEYAKEKGLEPIQVDGIPDGFAWKEPDVTIGNITHIGDYLAFLPLLDFNIVHGSDRDDLLISYNENV